MSAPAVAVSRDGKHFAAAWMDKRLGNEIARVYWAFADQPKFTSDAPVNSIKSGEQNHPSVAFDSSGTVWAVWEQNQGGKYQIWYRSSEQSSVPRPLSVAADGRTYQPVVACNDGVVVVVYESVTSPKQSVICQVLAR